MTRDLDRLTPPTRPAAAEGPVAARRSPADTVLRIQRTAGNRAVGRLVGARRALARRVTADVRTGDVGDFFADQLTADELREQVKLLVSTLEQGVQDPAARQTMEQNLEFLVEYGAAHGTELPAATAHDFRIAIASHLNDLRQYVATIKKIAPDSEPPGTPEYTFRSRLEWQIDQLAWVTDGVKRATELVNEAQNGGDDAAKKFTAAGNELTASIFGLKALAILLAYDDLEYEVEKEYPHTVAGPRNAAERMHHEFASVLGELRVWESGQLNQAVNTIVSSDWSFDFGAVKDLAEEQIQATQRFLGWLNIVLLAWTAFDIWMIPVAGGGPGGGGGTPRIGGIGGGGGGAAVATGTVLATADAVAALRRLAAVGALTTPKLVKLLGGRTGGIQAPPKPIEAATKGSKSGGTGGAGKAGGTGGAGKEPAGGAPDPNVRLAPGLPTAAEDAVIKRYTKALSNLRDRSAAYKGMKPKAGEAPAKFQERFKRARTAYESALRELDAIEAEAVGPKGGELPQHLDPLVRARQALEAGGVKATTAGTKVECDAVRQAPKNLRGMDFAEIEKTMGRPPDGVEAATKPGGGGKATGHQRLWWKFKDGSRLVIDDPRALGGRAASADLPHAELHGPGGERLDQQGIEVPEASISAHMTITDYLKALENHFAPARKGR